MTNQRQWVREHDSADAKAPIPQWHWFPGGQYSHSVCGHQAICGMPYVVDRPYDPPPEQESEYETWCSECKRLWDRDQEGRKPVMVEPQRVHVPEQEFKPIQDVPLSDVELVPKPGGGLQVGLLSKPMFESTSVKPGPGVSEVKEVLEEGHRAHDAEIRGAPIAFGVVGSDVASPDGKIWVPDPTPDPKIAEAVRERREAKPYNLPQEPPPIPDEEYFKETGLIGGTEIVGCTDNTPSIDELFCTAQELEDAEKIVTSAARATRMAEFARDLKGLPLEERMAMLEIFRNDNDSDVAIDRLPLVETIMEEPHTHEERMAELRRVNELNEDETAAALNAQFENKPAQKTVRMDRVKPVNVHVPPDPLTEGFFSDVIIEEVNIDLMKRQLKGLSLRVSEMEVDHVAMFDRLNTIQACVEEDEDEPDWETIAFDNGRKVEGLSKRIQEMEGQMVFKQSSYDQLQREFVSYLDAVKEEREATEAEIEFRTTAKVTVLQQEVDELRDRDVEEDEEMDKTQRESERVAKLYIEQKTVNDRAIHEINLAHDDKVDGLRLQINERRREMAVLTEENRQLKRRLTEKEKLDAPVWAFVQKCGEIGAGFLGRNLWVRRESRDLSRRKLGQEVKDFYEYEEPREGEDSD